ncbi:MAG: hypothetical protein P0Y55_01975 [Candidatus Cohnella colombiensis]|uniref:Uncharacterized protein n=1 Tax=Candidatus Cohnella colombiensis TaxID=3121368 RepID=A0AA95EXR0_9BACL|nr:MAG: hypothetical protein P0Y55_01975 [Cohnella sp.]
MSEFEEKRGTDEAELTAENDTEQLELIVVEEQQEEQLSSEPELEAESVDNLMAKDAPPEEFEQWRRLIQTEWQRLELGDMPIMLEPDIVPLIVADFVAQKEPSTLIKEEQIDHNKMQKDMAGKEHTEHKEDKEVKEGKEAEKKAKKERKREERRRLIASEQRVRQQTQTLQQIQQTQVDPTPVKDIVEMHDEVQPQIVETKSPSKILSQFHNNSTRQTTIKKRKLRNKIRSSAQRAKPIARMTKKPVARRSSRTKPLIRRTKAKIVKRIRRGVRKVKGA